ncbi:MAG: ABC transporter ATP-binding protein [Verrucomicrobiota bacterium]
MSELKRVFAYCARYKWYAGGTFTCAVLSTLSLLLVPYLTKLIFELIAGDEISGLVGTLIRSREITEPNMVLLLLGLLAAGAFLGRDLLNAARIYFNNMFEQRVIFDIRSDLYEHIQRLPLSWFDDKASGDIMTRVSEDVTNMERVLIDGIEQGSVALLQICGILGYMAFVNWQLTLWTLIPIPLMLVGALWYTTTAHKRYRLVRIATSNLNALLMDNLQGVAQIKSFVRESSELQHFREKSSQVMSSSLRVMKAWAIYSPSMTFFASLGTVLVLFFGGQMVLNPNPVQPESGLQYAELVSFMVAVGFLYEPISRLHQLNQLFQSGRAASERVFGILDTQPEGDPVPSESLAPAAQACAVEFSDVQFTYDKDLLVLNHIQLDAKPGQTIALVGPTGAGKSTLVGLIPRFYGKYEGTITIDGIDNRKLSLRELRSLIGVVSQEAFLFNDTLRRNLLFGKPDAADNECWEVLEAAHAREFVEALPDQLDTVVGERGIKLSVGEKQRVSIARALLKNPPILILDEATASVDTATEKLIQQALDHLLKNRTSFVIAHRLSTIVDADQILVLRQGEIIERGTHQQLLEQDGLYAGLCQAQSTGTIEAIWDSVHAGELAEKA